MNSYDFFIYEFICFMNSYMNSGVPRFQMPSFTRPSSPPGPALTARPGPYLARLWPATPRPPRPTRPRRRSGQAHILPEPKRRCRPNQTTAIPCPSRAGAEQLPSGPSPSRWPLPSHTRARRRSRAGRSRPGRTGASPRDSQQAWRAAPASSRCRGCNSRNKRLKLQ